MEDTGNHIEQFELEQKKDFQEKPHRLLKIIIIIDILVIIGLIVGIIVLAVSKNPQMNLQKILLSQVLHPNPLIIIHFMEI